MKKIIFLVSALFLIFLSSCGKKEEIKEEKVEVTTRVYKSEIGDITVPSNPQRIVVLNSSLSGHLLALNAPIIGIDKWSKDNPTFSSMVKDIPVVSDENLEQIIELNPDLIITASTDKNLEKLKTIAPTVTYTYNKVDYLTQFIEIGKLINKEEEAANWVNDFKAEAKKLGEEVKSKIGQNTTVTVIESYEKQLYLFGNNFARGTEILYNEMGLKMPESVNKVAGKTGFYAISPEVLKDFSGDYIIFSKNQNADNSFEETKVFKNIDAVKNNKIFILDAKTAFFNDPITLKGQLDFFRKSFLGN
jgi:iron complex transport system substrate-binding protein